MIEIDELDGDELDDLFYYQEKPFTGTAIEKDKNGTVVLENNYFDGFEHGPSFEYSSSGQILSQKFCVRGVLNGYQKEWAISGDLIKESYYELGALVYEHDLKNDKVIDKRSDKLLNKYRLNKYKKIACVDVQYHEDDSAISACVVFEDFNSGDYIEIKKVKIEKVEEYISGQFYKRELPCILKVIEDLHIDLLIIDGYVDFGSEKEPALGKYLYDKLNYKIPIIGVAKNPNKSYKNCSSIIRGESSKPLWISSVGTDIKYAMEVILKMHGEYRLPTLLKLVDSICREI